MSPQMRLDGLDGRRKRGRGLRTFAFLILVSAGAVGSLVLFRAGPTPIVKLNVGLPALGPRTPLTVTAEAEGRGLAGLTVRLRQGDQLTVLHEETFVPRPPWAFWGDTTTSRKVDLTVEKDQMPNPRLETATLEVVAHAPGTLLLSAPTSSVAKVMQVRLRPPRLAVMSENVFVAQGGCEAVAYTVSGRPQRHGVRAGGWFFPGYPLPGGGEDEYFSLFAIPYDMGDIDEVRLEAEDDVGNVGKADFIDQFTPRPFKTDTIRVSDGFMEVVVPRILARTEELDDLGVLLDNYVNINRELRKANNDRLMDLAKKTKPRFYWKRSFVQMPAKVVSAFADRRTYIHEGKKIDRQDHLGFDLASVKKAKVPSANQGVVIFADYLGIYGNTVVVDHGYGLQSLYAHLSKVEVEVGDEVDRGQTLGRTGATGLALGDHLHFTMMLHGLPVTPIEWWDDHWIQDRIALKLGDALGYDKADGR